MLVVQTAQPAREKGRGQRVRRGEADFIAQRAADFADMVAAKRQAPHDLFGQDAKRLSRLGQRDAVRVAIDERRADPVLERADAAAERRPGQVASFGRAGTIRWEARRVGKMCCSTFRTRWSRNN